MAKEKLR
jgi:hypothetical protein